MVSRVHYTGMEGQLDQAISGEILTDRQLLRRFVQDSDEQAFAEIVRRYERLVMSVARRVIGSGAEVDDAFQATFITLARRPRQIRKIESLSSWLYSVAWRVSVRLVRARRKHPVQPIPDEQSGPATDPLQQIADDQDAVILDEELQMLPNKYRDVLVMTYFADQTSQQIADQLDISKGTVDGRIRQGRNMLRVKLARRGVGIGALAAAANLMATEAASASPSLVSNTIQLGTQTISQSLPGTTDISNLEPLVRPEITSMIGMKAVLSTVIGIAAFAGLAGVKGADGPKPGAGKTPGRVDTLQAELAEPVLADKPVDSAPAEPVLVTVGSTPTTLNEESPDVENLGEDASRAAFTSYPKNARPNEKWLYETLEKSAPAMDYEQGTSLSDVLADLAKHYSSLDEDNIMQVWPDTIALSDVGVDSLDDLVLRRDLKLKNVSLDSALNLLLSRLDGVDESLEVMIKDEVLMITTAEEAADESNYFIRTYEVAALMNLPIETVRSLSSPGGGGGGGFFSLPTSPALQAGGGFGSGSGGGGFGGGSGGGGMGGQRPAFDPTLVTVIMDMTRPPALWQDIDGDGGSIAVVGQKLVVRQSAKAHREIVKLLNLLMREL